MDGKCFENIRVNSFLKDIQSNREHLVFDRNEENNYFNFPNSLVKLNNRKENDINKDIGLIEQILQAIIDYETNQINLRQTLITIGKLSGEISYNDLGDNDNHYIRNRYGYIQRNKNKSINKNGVYFEQLYRLNIILTNDQIAMSIPEEEINNLRNHLSNLKQKIAHILMDKNPSIHHKNLVNDIIIDFSAQISDIIDFSIKYYHQLILQRLNDELDQLEIIDFSNKDDRYYFGRVFCIIGELFNEWFEDRMIGEKVQVLIALKYFIKLRDQLIHHHEILKYGLDNENQFISELIIEIKFHLKQVIVNNKDSIAEWEINFSYIDASKFDDIMDRLLAAFSGKSIISKTKMKNESKSLSKKKKQEQPETNEKIKSRLNRLISRACAIIEGKKSEIKLNRKGEANPNSIENQLKFVNDQYQQNLCKLETDDRCNYPIILDMMSKHVIKKFSESLVQSSSKDLDPCDELNYKFLYKINSIKEEVDYLLVFNEGWSKEELNKHTRKQRYITQQIMNMIGQLVREIESFNMCKLTTTNNSSHFNEEMLSTTHLLSNTHFNNFSSSVLIREGEISSKQLRNKGLAHNVWSFDDDNFFDGLVKLSAAHSQFYRYYNIMMKDMVPSSAISLLLIGISFLSLGFEHESICYLEKAVERLKDYPDEADIPLKISDDLKNEFENIFQMKCLVFHAYDILTRAYFSVGNLKKAIDINTFLVNQINKDKIENLSNHTSTILLSLFKCKLAISSNDLEQSNESIKLLENMDNQIVDIAIKNLLATYYLRMENYEKSKEVYKEIINVSTNCVDQFEALSSYVEICFINPRDENQNSEINMFIDTMEKLLEDNLLDFKSRCGDRYYTKKIEIIIFRLKLIIRHDFGDISMFFLNKEEMDKMSDLSNQFKDIISKFHYTFQDDPKIFELCIRFSLGYQSICLKNKLSGNPIAEDLRESQFYFYLAEKIIERFPETEFPSKPFLIYLEMVFRIIHSNFGTRDQNLRTKIEMENLLTDGSLSVGLNSKKNLRWKDVADVYFRLGEEYFVESCNGDKEDIACLALSSYENAIKFYNLMFTELSGDDIIDIIYVGFQLAICSNSISILKCDLKVFVQCKLLWKKILNFPLNVISRTCALKLSESHEYILNQIIQVLEQILSSLNGNNELQFHDEYIVRYLRNKFSIEIINESYVKKWIYRGILSIDELRNLIQDELKYYYNETF